MSVAQNAFERLVALLLILIASPVLLFLALAIVIDDPGPVFFRQVRVGRFGKDFRILKFRTMSDSGTAEAGAFEPGNDRRVTRVGKFARATKLDELPQLVNVLLGDMSLVGPRPEVRIWVEEYPDEWAEILQRRPGITDPAAVVYKDEEQLLQAADDPEHAYAAEILPRKLAIYRDYAARRTPWTDLKVILDTVNAVFLRKR